MRDSPVCALAAFIAATMTECKVNNVNVISYASAVGSGIIIAEYAERCHFS